MAATVVSCWRSREELGLVLLDDSLCQPKALIHSSAHTNARARRKFTRRHVLVVVEEEGARRRVKEGFLIKAHQGRSFSTGGRVVQEHRDTPAARRQSEGDGIEQQQLEDTQAEKQTGNRTERKSRAGLCKASFLNSRRIKPVPSTDITPRHELLLLNIIDAELSGTVLSSSVSPPLSFLFLCLSPGL